MNYRHSMNCCEIKLVDNLYCEKKRVKLVGNRLFKAMINTINP